MTLAPVNVSQTCITISAGYVCVVRLGTAQDQAYHLPPNVYCVPRPKNIRVVKKISKIVLGLEAEPHQGTTHYWGLPYLLVTSGAHSNKQTNKQTKERHTFRFT